MSLHHMCLINILLQTLATLIIGVALIPLGSMLILSVMIGVLHSALIYFIVGLAGSQYAKQA